MKCQPSMSVTVVCLFAALFTGVSTAHGQSTAGVGDNGSNQNLCLHHGVSAKCTFTVPESGTATAKSSAATHASGVAISGGASVAIVEGSTVSAMGTLSIATWPDALTIGNYPAGSSLFAAASTGSIATGQFNQIGLTLNLSDFYNGNCSTTGFGQTSCSATVSLQQSPVVTLGLNLGGGASANCDTVGCSAASAFNGSAKVLVLKVVDSNGNPVKGASVVSASEHKYPSSFASATALTASPNPSIAGQSVTFTATITSFGRADIPTGKVTFKDSTTGTTLGHVTLNAGVASLTTASLASGTHTITATYGGDSWSASSRTTVSQVVN
jgi:hypothetical protein